MDSRIERLLAALLNGDTSSFEPLSRNEKYLKACCNKSGTDGLPEPTSRVEALLYQLADQLKGGGGTAGASIRDYIMVNELSANSLFYNFQGSSIDDFLSYEDTRSVTNTMNMFAGCTNITTVPLFDTSSVTNMESMFARCDNITTVPLFDTSSVTSMAGMFDLCSNITTVPLFDTSSVTNMAGMFSSCSKLTTVPLFDIRSCTITSSMFSGCKAMTECWLRNIKTNLQVGSGTSYGHLLTLESLEHLIQELRNTGSSKTLTVGSANLAKLDSVYVKTIDVTDEMRAEDEFIDEKVPFVVCDSTDEGATLIRDYALTKKWTIK